MEMFVHYNYKKYLLTILIIILLPIILPIVNYFINYIIQAGRIIGSHIRFGIEGGVCII